MPPYLTRMEGWAWLIAYVLGFGLLQLVLYRYFRQRGGTFDRATPGGSEPSVQSSAGEQSVEPGPDSVRCVECGAVNANRSSVRYCRECVTPLE